MEALIPRSDPQELDADGWDAFRPPLGKQVRALLTSGRLSATYENIHIDARKRKAPAAPSIYLAIPSPGPPPRTRLQTA